jgi:hypothetical protein
MSVEEDAERVKLDEFKYGNFEVQVIKTIDQVVIKAGCRVGNLGYPRGFRSIRQ